MHKRIALLTLLAFTLTLVAAAQMGGDKPRPSPAASAACKFSDGKSIKIAYSSPRVKGRKIYGGLVPYGQVWRTGANEATTFVTDTALTIGGTEVPAGSYTLFTVPNADKWSLILSTTTGEWGTDYPGPSKDLGRFVMTTEKLPSPMENFTISFHEMGNGCHLYLDWESTRAVVEITEKK